MKINKQELPTPRREILIRWNPITDEFHEQRLKYFFDPKEAVWIGRKIDEKLTKFQKRLYRSKLFGAIAVEFFKLKVVKYRHPITKNDVIEIWLRNKMLSCRNWSTYESLSNPTLSLQINY